MPTWRFPTQEAGAPRLGDTPSAANVDVAPPRGIAECARLPVLVLERARCELRERGSLLGALALVPVVNQERESIVDVAGEDDHPFERRKRAQQQLEAPATMGDQPCLPIAEGLLTDRSQFLGGLLMGPMAEHGCRCDEDCHALVGWSLAGGDLLL